MKKQLTVSYLLLTLIFLFACIQSGHGPTGSGVMIPDTNLLIIFPVFLLITTVQAICYAKAKPYRQERAPVGWVVGNSIGVLLKSTVMYLLFRLLLYWMFGGLFSGFYFKNAQWNNFYDPIYSAFIMMAYACVLLSATITEFIITFQALKKKEI